MDDELEDKILYQTYLSYMKLVSKFAVNIPTSSINTPISYFWHFARRYFIKPEMLLLSITLFIMFNYLQTVEIWRTKLLGKFQYTLERTMSKFLVNDSSIEKSGWELKQATTAAYAIQGKRRQMEDRFVVNNNISNTGVSLFAIFDGHAGEFAANYARDKLIPNISEQVVKLKNIISGNTSEIVQINKNSVDKNIKNQESFKISANLSERRKSLHKTSLSTDDSTKKNIGITDPELLDKLDSLSKSITRQVRPSRTDNVENSSKVDIATYLDGNKINYGRLLTDQVLATDKQLVDDAKKKMDIAGTTALIALLEGNKLIVANVGDSRGVMCDGKGNAIPLSFDHKPQQQREKNRIYKAGGVIAFNGVWRVAGILATSRALGDYPLKDKKLVIAEPDILTFDLNDHKPMFIILATDGLWDTFSNEEAVAFIKERIDEPHFGAKSITLQSYYKGSLDNITVIVIKFKNRECNTNINETSI
ncbi:PREDICTED: protein phosphatase 1L [Ceratosolen solmsi marchali]|uniref:Protein phosphatase 1L n=1 Tax=Ceratosolen solmsi marchali TaxID=326594 RepID=A0AAJ6YTQ2_9HYME|nr:PREDICTED: protein phosphatase 1L [Ceratosolen solmsi marchali]